MAALPLPPSAFAFLALRLADFVHASSISTRHYSTDTTRVSQDNSSEGFLTESDM